MSREETKTTKETEEEWYVGHATRKDILVETVRKGSSNPSHVE